MSGPFGSSSFNHLSSSEFYNGVATQSLKFDDGDSAILSKTFSSAGDRRLWTFATWFKMGEVGDVSGETGTLFSAFQTSAKRDVIRILAGTLNFQVVKDGYDTVNSNTTRLFRDSSAWYHVVVMYDSAQSTNTNRTKVWVNGEQQALTAYVGQNIESHIGHSQYHGLGARRTDTGNYSSPFDGCFADTYYVNGQALDYTSFAEFKDGVLIPKEYTGAYGTNGFRFQFKETGTGTASSSTIGADTSGNGNHFTSSNLVASDSNRPDSPENNFATLNPLIKAHHDLEYLEGNLKITRGSGNYSFAASTIAVKTGKWYAELRPQGTITSNNHMVGICITNVKDQSSGDPYLQNGQINYVALGNGHVDDGGSINASTFSGSTSFGAGDIVGVALDLDSATRTVKFYKNNSLVNISSYGNLSSEFDGEHIYFMSILYGTNTCMWNFGQDSTFSGQISAGGNADANGIGDFAYAPPSGHLALCTANLPQPAIGPDSATQSDDNFKAVLYTGTGTSGNSVTVGFKTDWLWIKRRNGNTSHRLIDSTRGVDRYLSTDTQNAEDDATGIFTSFDTNGFTVEGTANATNGNTNTYVSWNWKANGGTTVSNTDGSITSTVQANTKAGFSIVTYTGNATAGATVGHGLGAVPTWYFVKRRSNTGHWENYHGANTSDPRSEHLRFTDGATEDSNVYWNDTAPTSTVFSLGNQVNVNENANTYVAYCFTDIEGYSKFGSHNGNNNSDGTFVYTGFRPAWVLVKNTETAGENWHIFDNVRGAENVIKARLIVDGNTQENTNDDIIDFVSNGFKWRDNNAGYNSSATFIYMAFAEAPFKYANAR